MPEDGEDKKENKQSELPLGDHVKAEPVLPPVVPPSTKTPFQFNQQINIQQIPTRAWEKLSAEQIIDLTKTIVQQIEKSDERQFNLSLEQAKSSARTQRTAMFIGGAISIVGFAAATYLATQGHQVIGGMLATFLATVIAVTIGNRGFQ